MIEQSEFGPVLVDLENERRLEVQELDESAPLLVVKAWDVCSGGLVGVLVQYLSKFYRKLLVFILHHFRSVADHEDPKNSCSCAETPSSRVLDVRE